MRRHSAKFLIALCLLLLVAVPIPRPPSTSSRISTVPDYPLEPVQTALDLKLWEETVKWHEAQAEAERKEAEVRAAAQTEESQHVAHFDPGSVQQLIVDVFGPAAPAALKVANCESHYNASAVNGRYRGVFQVGDMHAAAWLEVTGQDYWSSWMDPVANVTYAYSLYLSAGWGPWSCKP